MTLAEFIRSYGYFALFFGVMLEGETIVVMAGFAAHRGYLSLPGVVLVALAATVVGDQALFFIGRRRGRAFVDRREWLRPRMARVTSLLDRYHAPFIVGRRFLYGLRTISSMVLGMSRVRLSTFVVYNIIGAGLWASFGAALGYLFGAAMVILLGKIEHLEREILVGILIAGTLLWSARAAWARRRRRSRRESPGIR